MDLDRLTYDFIGRKLLDDYDSRILVDWALAMMSCGIENENVLILAGLENAEVSEREHYFWRAVGELGIGLKNDPQSILHFFAKHYAADVLSGKYDFFDGIREMYAVSIMSDHAETFRELNQLFWEMNAISYDGPVREPLPIHIQLDKRSRQSFTKLAQSADLLI